MMTFTWCTGWRRYGGALRDRYIWGDVVKKAVIGVIAFSWLAVGGVAADQRGDFAYGSVTCSSVGEISATMAVGLLNFQGVNPEVSCHMPRASA
jgi:hypothetical protein